MSPDWELARELARSDDPAGYLSVAVDRDPRDDGHGLPGWQARVEQALVAERARVASSGDTALLDALDRWLGSGRGDLDAVIDSRAPGRGRLLVAGLGSGRTHRVAVGMPVVEAVRVGRRPSLRSLVTALADGAPFGVALLSRTGVSVVESRLGLAEDVALLAYEEETSQARELRGPAGGGPGRAYESSSQEDLHARRLAEHLDRFLAATAGQLGAMAGERGWQELVLTGDSRLVDVTAAHLPGGADGAVVIRAAGLHEWRSPSGAADAVATEVAAARHDRGRRLLEQASDAARSGGRGALGLGDTLSALAEGRVHVLLLGRSASPAGSIAPDGRLVPRGEVPAGIEADLLVDEPALDDRLLERALRSDGSIEVVADDLVAASGGDGIAAILRW